MPTSREILSRSSSSLTQRETMAAGFALLICLWNAHALPPCGALPAASVRLDESHLKTRLYTED